MNNEPSLMDLYLWKELVKEKADLPADYVIRKYHASEKTEMVKTGKDSDYRRVRVVVSTGAVDHDNDTIKPTGWDVSTYEKNPTVLWAHDSSMLPIAKSVELTLSRKALKSLDEFPPDGLNDFADAVYGLIDFGALNAVSVGFKPKEWTYNEDRGGYDFKEQLMMEHSFVPIPSNPDALVSAKSAGIKVGPIIDYAERGYWELNALERFGYCKENLGQWLKAAGKAQVPVIEIEIDAATDGNIETTIDSPIVITIPSNKENVNQEIETQETLLALEQSFKNLSARFDKLEARLTPETVLEIEPPQTLVEITGPETKEPEPAIDVVSLKQSLCEIVTDQVEKSLKEIGEESHRKLVMSVTGRLD